MLEETWQAHMLFVIGFNPPCLSFCALSIRRYVLLFRVPPHFGPSQQACIYPCMHQVFLVFLFCRLGRLSMDAAFLNRESDLIWGMVGSNPSVSSLRCIYVLCCHGSLSLSIRICRPLLVKYWQIKHACTVNKFIVFLPLAGQSWW